MNSTKYKSGLTTSVLVKASLLTAISIVLTRFFSYMIPLGGMPALRIGFGNVPLIAAGMMFGPLVGGAVGVVADLIGYVLNPMGGAYFPGFTVSAALYGVLSGLLFKRFRIQKLSLNFNYINAFLTGLFALAFVGVMFKSGTLSFTDSGLMFTEKGALPMFVALLVVTVLFIALPFVLGRVYRLAGHFDKIAFAVSVSYIVNALFLNTLWLTIMLDKGFLLLLPGRIVASLLTIPVYTWILYTLSKVVPMIDE